MIEYDFNLCCKIWDLVYDIVGKGERDINEDFREWVGKRILEICKKGVDFKEEKD